MDTQPPEDQSELVQKVTELQTELTEVRRLLEKLAGDIDSRMPLTDNPNHRYYSKQKNRTIAIIPSKGSDNQENFEEEKKIPNSHPKQIDKSGAIPYIGEGATATCIRCGHIWTPFVRRPKQCPACRQAWYKPKAWTRTKSMTP